MFYRLYEYHLNLSDGRHVSLGRIKVFRLFDADDYFPMLVKRNAKHIISQVKELEPEQAEMFGTVNDAKYCLAWLVDFYEEITISAIDLMTDDSVILFRRHETDKERCRGRKFTFNYFSDNQFDYAGNWLKKLYHKLTDMLKQRLLYGLG
jgi:hypothetical protein